MAKESFDIIPVDDWALLISENGGGEIAMPFVHDTMLLERIRVVGGCYIDDIDRRQDGIVEGTILPVKRDPHNKYDAKAIGVYNPDGERIGFIPRQKNDVIANLMDSGKLVYAKVVCRDIDDLMNKDDIYVTVYMREL